MAEDGPGRAGRETDVTHDGDAQRPGDVLDPVAYGEACAVFGEADALARLREFCAELARHLTWIERDRPDHAALRDMAHRTAGRAGMLGFPALMEVSVTLDQAARRNDGVAVALDRWTEQARRAIAVPR